MDANEIQKEIDAVKAEADLMKDIGEVLSKVDNKATLDRVLRWALDRFGLGGAPPAADPKKAFYGKPETSTHGGGDKKEIPGIAILSDSGEFKLTIRDLKAKNVKDAAIRLVHVATRAYINLTGKSNVSSKSVILPLLKGWRVYDGNTRVAISRHKGIIRNGDEMSLDFHSQNDADKYMEEILDESVKGVWSPAGKGRK